MDKKALDAEKLIDSNDSQSNAAVWPRYAALALSVYVFLGGFISFLGYPLNLPALTDWNSEGISIQPNTTIAVMATGLTLLLLSFGYRRLPIVLSALVGLIGATSIFQMATEIDLGFNTFLSFGREWGRFGVVIPGLMGTPGATSWTLLGTALLLLSVSSQGPDQKDHVKARNSSVLLALLSMGISSLSLIGYLYGAKSLYAVPKLTIIALQTATFILAASLSVILLIDETGPMRLFADRGPAGILTRRIVPTIVLLPILVGALRLAGENAGLYDTAFGSASRTLVEIVFLLCILWWTGTALDRYARRASQNERELQQLADAMPQVVWIANEEGKTGYYNRRVENFGGIKQVDGELYDWQAGIHPEDLESTIKLWNAAVRDTKVYEQEHRMLMADGTYRWHLSRAVPLIEDDGRARRWYGTATDIHDQKSAEVTLRESEQRFSRFMQHLPGLSWIKDAYGKYVYANEAAQKAFNTPMPELFGKSDNEIFPADVAAEFTENDRKALESPLGLQTVEALKDETGKLRYSIVSKFPIPSANGSKPMVGGMAIDITEQKNAEANKEFLFKISEMIRIGRNAEVLLADISEALGRHMELHRCLFNEIDLESDTETVHRDYARDGESVAGTHAVSEYSSIASDAMRSGLTIVNQNSETDPRTADYFEKTYGPNREIAYIAVPMLRGGKWVASLWCSDDKPRVWTDVEVALVENIAERTWAAVERLRTEITASRLAAIVSSSDDAIISKDLNGIITSWNHGAERVFGYTPDEVIGRSVTILIPPDRLDEEPGILARVRKGESIDHYETVRRTKDGTLLDISLTVSPIYDSEGRIIGASKVARDITGRKEAEIVTSKLAAIVQSSGDAIISKDLNGIITSWNRGAEKVFGYEESEVIGKSVTILIPESRLDEEPSILKRIRNGESIEHYETVRQRKDGSLRDISLTVSPIHDADGHIIGASKVARDITEQKEAAEQLQLISRMPGENPNPVMRISSSGEFLYANDAAQPLIDFWKRTYQREISVEFEMRVHDAFENDTKQRIEVEYDGRILSCTLAPIREAGYVNVYADDITEQRRAQAELNRRSQLIELSFEPIFVWKFGEGIVEWNRGAEQLYGYTRDEALGRRSDELLKTVHPIPRDEFHDLLRQHGGWTGELRHTTKDGREVLIRSRQQVAEIDGLTFVLETNRDITEQRIAEDALRISEERYRTLFDSMDEGYCIIEVIFDENEKPVDYRFVEINPAFEHQSGMHDVVGRRMLEFVSEIEDHWLTNYGNVAITGEPVRFTGEYRGLHRFFEVYAFRIGDSFSHRIAVLFTDITSRKQAADALTISEERYRVLTELSPQFVFMGTPEGSITYVNQFGQDFLGKTLDELKGDGWARSLHPDHREAELEKWRLATATSTDYESDLPLRYKDGTYRTVYARAQPMIAEDGRFLYWIGTALDVEDRKQTEEKLRASETQLRLVTDAIPALVSYIDDKENYRFVNRQYSDWFGKSPSELTGKKMREVVGARAYAVIRPYLAEALSGTEVSFDSWINYKSAGQRYVHISYVPDKLADGRVVGLFGLVSDLSDLKRSEDLLRASQERMRLLTESFTDYAIFSTDVEGLIESWNPGAQMIFGYDEQEIIGKSSEILFIPEDIAKNVPVKERRNARDNGRSSDERWLVRKDGSRFFASGVMVPLYVAGILRGYAKIASDLTERKRNAEALQRAHDEMEFRVLERTRELGEANAALIAEINERKAAEEQKIDLLKRLVTTQEDERRRIARDIHDQLGQRLTALRLKIASLRELVGKDKELEARTTRLQEIAELLDSEVSFLAWELRPSAIEEFGLVDAIRAFVHEWSRHYGIEAEFQSAGMAKFQLDKDADTHLYRIAQEALNNIVKHANASKVNVIVERTGNDVILIVEDNGVGFDRSALKPRRKSGNGLGLTGMSERASLINGDTEIESTPGRGTTIFVRVPLRKADRNGNL